MATTNVTLTASWALIVDNTKEFTLGVHDNSPTSVIAIAAMDTEEDPSVTGQLMNTPTHQINRSLTGPGYIYARAAGGVNLSAWLHSWTE